MGLIGRSRIEWHITGKKDATILFFLEKGNFIDIKSNTSR